MAKFRIETLEGGISQLFIEGKIEEKEHELFQSMSHLSKSRPHVLVNLLGVETAALAFFDYMNELSARTKIKIITTNKDLIDLSLKAGLMTFPTLKSAALAFAGDETMSLLMAKLRDVPILNTRAYELVAYVSRPDASFNKLETMIKDQPSMVSQILKIANSAYFRRTTKSETLSQALVTLGFSTLRQLFVYNFYTSVGNVFKTHQDSIKHGRQCALLAEHICKTAGGNPEECGKVRLGGLLHDVGSQALSFFFPQQYERVLKMVREEKKPTFMAELLTFGIEHQKVGSVLAKVWNFPPYLENLIGDHHYLQFPNWNTLTLPIYCANNYLNERDGIPHTTFYQKLEGYFFIKKKDLPWKDTGAEFAQFLSSQEEIF